MGGAGMTVLHHGDTHQPARTVEPARRKNLMEQVIETLASGLGNSVAWLAETGVLFGVFALVWIALGVGLIWSQGSIDQAWESIRGLPLIIQALVWLLFLPVMIGLWIWETTWPLLVRLILVIGIAGWNLLVFLPRAAQAVRP
jgi:ABC-type amino acid transport system permease subunit